MYFICASNGLCWYATNSNRVRISCILEHSKFNRDFIRKMGETEGEIYA